MSDKISKQIDRALFDAAQGIEDAVARRAFVATACAGDEPRRTRLEQWLAVAGEAETFFEGASRVRTDATGDVAEALTVMGATLPLESGAGHDGPGSRIDRYRLLEHIGEGGCGVVYLAEQLEPVRRRVALKVIRSGLDSANVVARFESERQSLALMDHPGIARVLDGGATANGRPYFVMELVSGEKITDHCDSQKLGLKQRLELFIQVCQAIQHAHQKGVIHRDIKPSNVLVSMQDGVAVPKVIDFGIARAIEGRLTDHTVATAVGQLAGTPAYMCPEQAEGGQSPDTRGDVYSLGALLYELLAGRAPFSSKRLLQAGLYEMLRILREDEPPAPSAVLAGLKGEELAQVAAARDVAPGSLVSMLRGDLDWIVAKAMSKDRRGRYDTVNGLAIDVRRFLNDEPVYARPTGKLYLFRKLMRRHKLAFVATGSVMLALVAGLAVSSWFYWREREARQVQMSLREAAEAARANEARMLYQAKARESVSQAAMLLAEGKIEEADALLLKTPLNSIEPSIEAANVFRTLGDWNAIRQRWRQAADCFLLFLQASRSGPPVKDDRPLWVPLSIGSTLIEADRRADYERFRHETIESNGQVKEPMERVNLLRSCLLMPGDEALLARLQPHVDPLRAVVESNEMRVGQAGWGAYALAMFAWRSGDFAGALAWSRKGLASPIANAPRIAATHALAAMSAYRLGQVEAARADLEEARTILAGPYGDSYYPRGAQNGHWVDWTLARVLEREASAVMSGENVAR